MRRRVKLIARLHRISYKALDLGKIDRAATVAVNRAFPIVDDCYLVDLAITR